MLYKARTLCTPIMFGCVGALHAVNAHADFVHDSKVVLDMRNAYIDRDFKQQDAPKSRVGSWSQGFDLRFISGYTSGPLQFGLDASTQWVYRLDGGGGRGPDSVLPYDVSRGHQAREYGRAGVTAKIRYSKTELKIGELRPFLPVAFTDDGRQMLGTYTGAMLESKEWDHLTLTAGRLTEYAGRQSSGHDKMYLTNGPDIKRRSDGLNIFGSTYQFTPLLSATYFFGQLEDIYQQHYLGVTDVLPLGNGYSLKMDARYYHNKEDGDALYGTIDNRTYGAMAMLRKGSHGFGIGYQRMLGESPFPLVNDYAPQPFLINWSSSGFFKPNESSWQLRYDYDFAGMGLPGLRMSARYLRGTGIDRGDNALDTNVESERHLTFNYIVQSGPLKGVGFEWRNIELKTRYGTGQAAGVAYNENRLFTTYTYQF